MVGSAALAWPNDGRQDLGIVIILIDRFADGSQDPTSFSFDFYYHRSNSVAGSLQKMVGQMIVTFGRDYIDYVNATTAADEAVSVPAKIASNLTKVFIVHGHDGEARLSVARFIEKLGFEAVILHERPNKGRTIITKFREEAAGVGFAVVLMTPDDVGGKALAHTTGPVLPRARQNVVFELGFFIGALGSERVAAMVKGEIERPSDFDGVVYISLDDGSWKADLARELEAAGYHVDWNKAMRS
jgi:predicted nucleotide-binding protein